MIVPDGARGPVTQWTVTPRHLRLLRWFLALVILLVSSVVGIPLVLWPRLAGYEEIAQQNFTLRARLATIDRKMEEVDDALRVIRLYDSQIRSLARRSNLSGTGPLDDDEAAEMQRLLGMESPALTQNAEPGAPSGDPSDELPLGAVAPGDIRPVELWAMGVEARVARVVGIVSELEPRMSTLVQDLEAWRTAQSAFPTMWPVDGILSSGFGYRRSPFTRQWKFHTGVDIAAPRGTPIIAPAPGVVVFSAYYYGYGRMIEIDHGHGVHSRFAHNTQNYLSVGDSVDRGEILGTVGTTGRTTGPHLHYEILIHGRQVDPLDYLP